MSGVPDVRWRGVSLYAAVVVLWCMLAPWGASADQFTGKVVGISDGDTLSVLPEGKAVKVRLHGDAAGMLTYTADVWSQIQRSANALITRADLQALLEGREPESGGMCEIPPEQLCPSPNQTPGPGE